MSKEKRKLICISAKKHQSVTCVPAFKTKTRTDKTLYRLKFFVKKEKMEPAKKQQKMSELPNLSQEEEEKAMLTIVRRKTTLEKLMKEGLLTEEEYRTKLDKLFNEGLEGALKNSIKVQQKQATEVMSFREGEAMENLKILAKIFDKKKEESSEKKKEEGGEKIPEVMDISGEKDKEEKNDEDDDLFLCSNDDIKVVNLSSEATFSPKVGVRLNETWSIFVNVLNYAKGNTQGSFEVLAFERAAKDEKSKPYSFNTPIRYLEKILKAVSTINESAITKKIPTFKDLLEIERDEHGFVSMPDCLNNYTRTLFVIDLFTIKVS